MGISGITHADKTRQRKVQIIIATHKKYDMPADEMYLPLHVGAEGKKDQFGNDLSLGYTKDNTGDNISKANPGFCELTGLYWAWKNLDAEYIGLAHYRRHFSLKKSHGDIYNSVLTYDELTPLLEKYNVFVPSKRRYFIETLYSHYNHTHYIEQLDEARKIIQRKYPEYENSFDVVMRRRWGYMFNMFIMKRALLNEYCEWLFDILFSLGAKMNTPEMSAFQGRFYGRVSELLFNVWLLEQIKSERIHQSEIKEFSYIYIGKIDWWKKGTSFLKAKFFHKKYEQSF